MLRRLALILLAYLIATGAAALTLSIAGQLLMMADGMALPAEHVPGSLLNTDVWRSISIGAAAPSALSIALVEWRRITRPVAHVALGGASGLATMAGYVYRTGATPDFQPLLMILVAGLLGGAVYWALMRTVN